MTSQNDSSISSVETCLRILEALETDDGTLVSLDDRLETSKSTIYKHLNTLMKHGYVTKEGSTYDLSARWLSLGGYARQKLPLYRNCRRAVRELAMETGELAVASTIAEGHYVTLFEVRGENAIHTDRHIGMAMPFHCTASGKAMLAAHPSIDSESYLRDRTLESYTENTTTEVDDLLAEFETIRTRGYALDDEERITGLRGVAAPVTDERSGELYGAVAVTGSIRRIDGERFEQDLPDLISSIAREIEIDLLYEETR